MQSVCYTHLSAVSVLHLFFACCSPFSLASEACFSVLSGSLRTKCCVGSHQPCEWSCSTWSTLHVFLWLPWEQCFNLSDVQQMLHNSIALNVYKSFDQSYIHQSSSIPLVPHPLPHPRTLLRDTREGCQVVSQTVGQIQSLLDNLLSPPPPRCL